jgi:hypothetical protein
MRSSIKLTSGQAETFALLHASVCNALIYAEDLLSYSGIFKEAMPPILVKLRWLKSVIEMRIPFEKRAVQVDTLRYDEILRMLTHLSQEDLDEIERVLKFSLKESQ